MIRKERSSLERLACWNSISACSRECRRLYSPVRGSVRVPEKVELGGLDTELHGEVAYIE